MRGVVRGEGWCFECWLVLVVDEKKKREVPSLQRKGKSLHFFSIGGVLNDV